MAKDPASKKRRAPKPALKRQPRNFNDSIAQDPDWKKWAWLDGNIGLMQAIKD